MIEFEEHIDGEYLICPYCKFEHGDMFEAPLKEWRNKWNCEECGETFLAYREVEVDYCSAPLPEVIKKLQKKKSKKRKDKS